MKCPICDGGGRITSLPSGMPVKCTRCNGTGEVEQTNEEWFVNLTTEEKALWLTKETRNSAEVGQWCTKDYWQKWLKAVHK